jgi:hydroxymethylglutaryl-CoA lyase
VFETLVVAIVITSRAKSHGGSSSIQGHPRHRHKLGASANRLFLIGAVPKRDTSPMPLPTHVTLVDVGPRDGLQNEKQPVPTQAKIELVQRLQDAGLSSIEVTSYVSPKWVPQMADNAQVMRGITRKPGVRYSVLVPNMQGLDAALADPATRPDEVVVFGAASEAFSRKNINCSIDESIDRFAPVVQRARAEGLKVRGAISTVVGCPYEGEVHPDRVEHVVVRMKAIGVQHVNISDTIGTGTPTKVQAAMERALKHFPVDEITGHFHDTYGQALANTLACLEMGIHVFDTSVAGLGGCPYAKGATGNVATEDVVYMLHGMGIDTGIDLDKLIDAGVFISGVLGRPTGSRVAKALLTKRGEA